MTTANAEEAQIVNPARLIRMAEEGRDENAGEEDACLHSVKLGEMGPGAQQGAGELEANSRRGSNAPKVAPANVNVAPARNRRRVFERFALISYGFGAKASPDLGFAPSTNAALPVRTSSSFRSAMFIVSNLPPSSAKLRRSGMIRLATGVPAGLLDQETCRSYGA